MVTISKAEAQNDMEQLWSRASKEPVTVLSAGQEVAVVLSPAEFARLTARRGAKAGFAKDLFQGVNPNDILNINVDDEFEDYQ